MPSNTDNNEFRKPDKGDTDYDVSFNTFFKQIDRAVEIRDTDANKSNYTPKNNAKFFATDTETIYIGDGTNWLQVASSGQNPTFSDAEADTVTITTSITDPSGTTHTGQLADDGDTQPPESHALGSSAHISDTLAKINAKVTDATLDDSSASRPPEVHGNTAHSTDFSPQSHTHSGESISPSSVDATDVSVSDSFTDASGTTHSGELADSSEVSSIQSSSDVTHDDTFGGTDADAHHSKTTSAADLTDVSPDSTSNAHHSKTTSASELTDVSADSVSSAHHSKTTSATEITDVSPDSTSNAHHSKTTSASELIDVSADSVSSAHHSQTTSGDIDHNQTTNRTHSGDDLSPNSVSVSTSLTIPEVTSDTDTSGNIWIRSDL